MEQTKSVWASKTVWAGLVTIACAVAGIWGFDVSADEQVRIIDAIVTIVTALAGVVAIVGRVTAKTRVG